MNPSIQKQLVQKLGPKGALIVCVLVIIATLTAFLINSRAKDTEELPPTVQSQTDPRGGDFSAAENSNVSGVVGSHNSNVQVSNGSNSNNSANSNNIINSNVNNSIKVDSSVRKIENKTYNHQVNQYNQHPYQQGRASALVNSTPRLAATPTPATADQGISRRRDDPELQRLYEKLDQWGLRGEQIIEGLSVSQCGAAYAEWERGCPAILQEINDHVRLNYGLVKFFDREFGSISSLDSLYLPADELFRHCKDIFHTRAETLRNFSGLVEYELTMLKK